MTNQNNTPATISSIQQFSFFNPEQFDTMQRVAKMFANSELVPDMYKVSENNPMEKAVSNCIIAIDIANRIEANILMVMQNLVIIYGRPSWSSKFLIATVNTCGRFNSLQFKFEDLGEIKNYKYTEYISEWVVGQGGKKYKKTEQVERNFAGPVRNIQCIAFTSPKGSNEVLESSPVSIELALNEGWYTKKGSKWPTIPKQMLMYRTASFWTSSYAPELSMGMKTEDEVRDIVDIDYEDVSKSPEKDKQSNANKTEIKIPEEKKEEVKPKETPKPLDTITAESFPKVKELLINDFGVAPEVLTDEKTIRDIAREHGFDIVIKAAGGPGF